VRLARQLLADNMSVPVAVMDLLHWGRARRLELGAVRARGRLRRDVNVCGLGTGRCGRLGEELELVMRGRAGVVPALDT